MKITMRSILSGVETTRYIPITEHQFAAWQGGQLIQNAAPQLTADEREFLISGLTEEEMTRAFSESDDA